MAKHQGEFQMTGEHSRIRVKGVISGAVIGVGSTISEDTASRVKIGRK